MKLDNDVTKHTNTHYMHFASMCSVDSELDISIAILVSHPTLSCSTSEHALTGICLSAAKKKNMATRFVSSDPSDRFKSIRNASSYITVTDLSIETRFSLQFTRSSGRATGFECIVRTSSAPTASST